MLPCCCALSTFSRDADVQAMVEDLVPLVATYMFFDARE